MIECDSDTPEVGSCSNAVIRVVQSTEAVLGQTVFNVPVQVAVPVNADRDHTAL